MTKESKDYLKDYSSDWIPVVKHYLPPVSKMPVLCPMSVKSNIFPVLLFFIPLRQVTCHHFLRNNPEKRPLTKSHYAFKDHTSLYSWLRSSELAQLYPSLSSEITLALILFPSLSFLSSAKGHFVNSASSQHANARSGTGCCHRARRRPVASLGPFAY
jgi:hypothetical protein